MGRHLKFGIRDVSSDRRSIGNCYFGPSTWSQFSLCVVHLNGWVLPIIWYFLDIVSCGYKRVILQYKLFGNLLANKKTSKVGTGWIKENEGVLSNCTDFQYPLYFTAWVVCYLERYCLNDDFCWVSGKANFYFFLAFRSNGAYSNVHRRYQIWFFTYLKLC